MFVEQRATEADNDTGPASLQLPCYCLIAV